jgi:2-iminobutanoate/2-iminopropanoate deaminase
MKSVCVAVLVALFVCARAEAQHHKPEYKAASGAMANLPFSEAVRVGDMLYISGAIGVKPGTMQLVEGGIVAETRQTMENIKAAVERHGSDMHNVVKCLVMMADMKEWGQMNDVYITFFPKNKPARSAFGASGLALNARVEIECTAVVKS